MKLPWAPPLGFLLVFFLWCVESTLSFVNPFIFGASRGTHAPLQLHRSHRSSPVRSSDTSLSVRASWSRKQKEIDKDPAPSSSSSSSSSWSLPRAVELYADYAGRLWNETNPEARRKIASDRAVRLIRQLQQVLGEDDVLSLETSLERRSVVQACDKYLNVLKLTGGAAAVEEVDATVMNVSAAVVVDDNQQALEPKKKPRRSILFGAAMGLVVAGWVFSGDYIFTGLFTLMTVLGQLEYYRMVINTGVYPARRISIIGACSMFLTALFTPNLHQICLPMFGLWAMVWFLTMKRSVTTIPEIATTFTGMFYLGYVPSFWVRIRLLGATVREPTALAPLTAPFLRWMAQVFGSRLPYKVAQAVHFPITTGAVFIFWTWLCLAFSDVGAYFVGRKYGRTKLGVVAPAAGATSPNKTVEGVVGGCAVSAVLAILGAWVQKWPYFWVTGALHGVALGILGLVGDLTASMLKRDAGLKDFGNLIPEHGGILDRVDSFVWAAPYSWLICSYAIPALKAWWR